MFRILFLLFLIVPTIEIYVLIQVGQVIGLWQTILLMILAGILGAYLAKSQGRQVWYKLQRDLSLGLPPADSILDGVCVLVGGILLLTPGFVTDLMGVALLLPITRIPIKRALKKRIELQIRKKTGYF